MIRSAVIGSSSRPEITAALNRGVCRLLVDHGFAPLREAVLGNKRRADVLALNARGEFWIVETKSCIEDWRSDHKWREYEPFCDALFLAVDCDFPHAIAPAGLGLIVADGFGGTILRAPPPRSPLPPARRKAMTLAFARLAALRLHGIEPAPD